MIPTNNAELDQLTIEHDARQGDRVLKQVYDFLGRFVSYPDEESRVAHTLWCVHAHLMHLWVSTPRLAFLSAEPASGKSRALEITSLLVPNAVLAVNMSPAYLFRRVGEREGAVTILFDEIDTVFGPKAKENEEIRGLLNAGHRRGAIAGRCVMRGSTVETEDCPAYAALAVAGLGWLPDTLMSRSIAVRMRRRAADERVEPYRPRLHDPQGAAVRHQIETWIKTLTEIDLDAISLPREVEDRDADCWEPLLAIAEAAGGDWPERARAAAVVLVLASRDREASLGVRLLTDIQQVFDAIVLSTKELIRRLIEIPESPWGDIRGKSLDERGLAHRLRQYEIKSRQIRIGETTMKGYRREDFADAWRRYVYPSAARSETSETSETSEQNQRQNVSDAFERAKQAKHIGENVSDVSDGVSDRGWKKINKNSDVSDVSDVSLFPGDGEGPDPDGYTFNLDDNDLDIPGFLDRRGSNL
jgi:Protein of unknown function (DUF3631)